MAAHCSLSSRMCSDQYLWVLKKGNALGKAGSSHRLASHAAWYIIRRVRSGSINNNSLVLKS